MDFPFSARSLCMAGAMTALVGCSAVDPARLDTSEDQYDYLRKDVRNIPWLREGRILGEDNSLLDNLRSGRDENTLPVNKYLWRASLDTLSFLPLASVDTFSGVIATDWGATAGSSSERVRVTTYVRDAALSATALDVSVFRETLTPAGVWQSAAVDPATARQLKDAILTRARQLRIADVDG